MTAQEVIEKFGDVQLRYSFYYKYSFYLCAEKDGYKFEGVIGGNPDAIYRSHIIFSETISVAEFEDSLIQFTITKDKEEIFSYEYDY